MIPIYRAAKLNSEISGQKMIMIINSFIAGENYKFGAQMTCRTAVTFSCRQIKHLKTFVWLLRGHFFIRMNSAGILPVFETIFFRKSFNLVLSFLLTRQLNKTTRDLTCICLPAKNAKSNFAAFFLLSGTASSFIC